MRIEPALLAEAFLIKLERQEDARGSFARLFCHETLQQAGYRAPPFCQVSLSENRERGTLRGMHYQSAPYEEAKLVYCLRGSIHDVIVDLRKHSCTYKQHFAVELSAQGDYTALFIPKGCAHGFLTLESNVQLLYFISAPYQPESAHGFRFDDPVFAIDWPFLPSCLSLRDQTHPPFEGFT